MWIVGYIKSLLPFLLVWYVLILLAPWLIELPVYFGIAAIIYGILSIIFNYISNIISTSHQKYIKTLTTITQTVIDAIVSLGIVLFITYIAALSISSSLESVISYIITIIIWWVAINLMIAKSVYWAEKTIWTTILEASMLIGPAIFIVTLFMPTFLDNFIAEKIIETINHWKNLPNLILYPIKIVSTMRIWYTAITLTMIITSTIFFKKTKTNK